jgi:hypothetical protein
VGAHLLARDDFTGTADEKRQGPGRLRLEPDQPSLFAQLARRRVELEDAKPVNHSYPT